MSIITLKLKRIDPVKWAIIVGILYAILSLVIVVPMFLFMSALGFAGDLGPEAGIGIFGGGVMMLLMPILYGVFAFVITLIGAFIFNFVLKKTKGLDMEFEKAGLEIEQLGNEII